MGYGVGSGLQQIVMLSQHIAFVRDKGQHLLFGALVINLDKFAHTVLQHGLKMPRPESLPALSEAGYQTFTVNHGVMHLLRCCSIDAFFDARQRLGKFLCLVHDVAPVRIPGAAGAVWLFACHE